MLIKEGVQGVNYYADEQIEKFRYNPYRIHNRKVAEESYATNKILPFPLHVIIETSAICNLKCGFCNREVMTRPQTNMSLEVFKKVVDECAENQVHSLSLYCLGEPMINPNIREMVIYAKGRGIPYVDLSTNGSYDLEPLLGTGLDEVIVSLDGFEATHEALRKGSSWRKVVDNLYGFRWSRNERADQRPIIRLQVIDLPETEKDRDKFIEWGLGYADVVYVKKLEVMPALGDKNLSREKIDERLKVRRPCKALWFTLTVNSTGEIAYCPHDPQGKAIIGGKTLKEAWECIDEMRQKHKTGQYTELCERCVDFSW